MKLFEFIKNLDESGNYRLADKIDNELRKIYAQTLNQPQNTYTDFLVKQMIQNQMKPKKETDTLSPTKNTDVATIRKQLNKVISDITSNQKKVKNLENSLGAIPSLESKIGNFDEQTENLSSKINDNTNTISENTQDINTIYETIDNLE
jgi:uncharacterized coiled-coil DUF342 family protein